jgi:hypothetical protein
MLFTVKVGQDGSWRCQILRAELQPCFSCLVLAPFRNTIRPPFPKLKQDGGSVPVFLAEFSLTAILHPIR